MGGSNQLRFRKEEHVADPERPQVTSEQLKALEERISNDLRSVAQGCAQQVDNLRRQLAELADQQAALIPILRETIPDLDHKLEEKHKILRKQIGDTANQIVQNFSKQYGRKASRIP
jgi:hypothetical protein